MKTISDKSSSYRRWVYLSFGSLCQVWSQNLAWFFPILNDVTTRCLFGVVFFVAHSLVCHLLSRFLDILPKVIELRILKHQFGEKYWLVTLLLHVEWPLCVGLLLRFFPFSNRKHWLREIFTRSCCTKAIVNEMDCGRRKEQFNTFYLKW